MIHFQCKHCGHPVRIPDAHAGKRGRCPACKGIVTVPHGEAEAAAGDEIAALASAAEGARGLAAEETHAVPPPPARADLEREEIELPSSTKAPSDETDILPAQAGDSGPSEPQTETAPETPPQDTPKPAPKEHVALAGTSRGKVWILVAVAAFIVLAALVAVFLLLPL